MNYPTGPWGNFTPVRSSMVLGAILKGDVSMVPTEKVPQWDYGANTPQNGDTYEDGAYDHGEAPRGASPDVLDDAYNQGYQDGFNDGFEAGSRGAEDGALDQDCHDDPVYNDHCAHGGPSKDDLPDEDVHQNVAQDEH